MKSQVIPLAVLGDQFGLSSSAYKMDVSIKIMMVPNLKRNLPHNTGVRLINVFVSVRDENMNHSHVSCGLPFHEARRYSSERSSSSKYVVAFMLP